MSSIAWRGRGRPLDRQLNNELTKLRSRVLLLEQIIVTLVPSGVGEMYHTGADTPLTDITSAAWLPLTAYTSTVPAVADDARGVTLDIVAGTIAFKVAGIWQLAFNMSLSHDERNQSRIMLLRFENIVAGTQAIADQEINIARNQSGTNYQIVGKLEITPAQVDQPHRAELSAVSGDVFESVVLQELRMGALYADDLAQLQPGVD